jgi:hypothetical protein
VSESGRRTEDGVCVHPYECIDVLYRVYSSIANSMLAVSSLPVLGVGEVRAELSRLELTELAQPEEQLRAHSEGREERAGERESVREGWSGGERGREFE